MHNYYSQALIMIIVYSDTVLWSQAAAAGVGMNDRDCGGYQEYPWVR